MDWINLKSEYVNTEISYRKLAEKYNISIGTLQLRAKKEKWFEERKKQRDRTMSKILQKTSDKIAKDEVTRIKRIMAISDRVVDSIDKAVGQLDVAYVEGQKVKTGVIDTYKQRQIVQNLKDLKDLIKEGADGGESSEEQHKAIVSAILGDNNDN